MVEGFAQSEARDGDFARNSLVVLHSGIWIGNGKQEEAYQRCVAQLGGQVWTGHGSTDIDFLFNIGLTQPRIPTQHVPGRHTHGMGFYTASPSRIRHISDGTVGGRGWTAPDFLTASNPMPILLGLLATGKVNRVRDMSLNGKGLAPGFHTHSAGGGGDWDAWYCSFRADAFVPQYLTFVTKRAGT